MTTTTGQRVTYTNGDEWPNPGSYWRNEPTKIWFALTPNGLLANLSRHQITEHEDGTITVLPSIEVTGGVEGKWHGYLEKGVWREV